MTSNFLREPDLPRQLFRGYSRDETDALLQRAAATVDKLRKSVTALRQELASAPEKAESTVSEQPPRIFEVSPAAAPASEAIPPGEILISAHRAVELLKEDARREAGELLAAARSRAAEIVAEAGKERRELEKERAVARGLVDDARAEAEQIVRDAKLEHDLILMNSKQLKLVAEDMRRTWIAQMTQAVEQLADATTLDPSTADADSLQEVERALLARLSSQSESHNGSSDPSSSAVADREAADTSTEGEPAEH